MAASLQRRYWLALLLSVLAILAVVLLLRQRSPGPATGKRRTASRARAPMTAGPAVELTDPDPDREWKDLEGEADISDTERALHRERGARAGGQGAPPPRPGEGMELDLRGMERGMATRAFTIDRLEDMVGHHQARIERARKRIQQARSSGDSATARRFEAIVRRLEERVKTLRDQLDEVRRLPEDPADAEDADPAAMSEPAMKAPGRAAHEGAE